MRRSWTDDQLKEAIKNSYSLRSVLIKIKLKPAGGNYIQLQKYIKELSLDISHFTGKAWNKGLKFSIKPRYTLEKILVKDSDFQSYKLKRRLFAAGIKQEFCEQCGWAQRAPDGRLPLELDHINGVHSDNRLENLRILCPNCHSLTPTHRGRKNKH